MATELATSLAKYDTMARRMVMLRSVTASTNVSACANARPSAITSRMRPNKERGRSLHIGAEHIALVAHRLDVARAARAIAQPLAHAAHQQVDGAVEHIGIAPLCELQQLVACEDALRVVQQHTQQAVFGAR